MNNKKESPAARNPVLPGDWSDPSVVRVGEDYYLVTSTFQYFPGVPVLHSRDLVNWNPIGHVLTRKSQLDLNGLPDSYGVYAPDISYADGRFWVVVPVFHGQHRCTNYLFTSERPEGPYSEPILLNHHFIDPSLLHDEDGRKYLAFGGGWVQELAKKGTKLIGEPQQVWPGTGGVAPEGPHLVRKDGWYYLLLAEGGTSFGHMATIARSRSIWGPYEPCPHNPILKQRNPEHPIQKTGHGKFVQSVDGSWWMLHLGGRPLTPRGKCPLGRETFLEPVVWSENDWPVVGDNGAPVEYLPLLAPVDAEQQEKGFANQGDTDGQARTKLGPAWEWVRNPIESGYSLSGDTLRISCKPYSLFSHQSTLALTRRWTQLQFTTETVLRFEPITPGEEAGLLFYRDSDSHLVFGLRNGRGQLSGESFDVSRLNEVQEEEGLFLTLDIYIKGIRKKLLQQKLSVKQGAPVTLRVKVDCSNESMSFFYSTDRETFLTCGKTVDPDFLYPEAAARWFCFTAPRVGVFAKGVFGTESGVAWFDQFGLGS